MEIPIPPRIGLREWMEQAKNRPGERKEGVRDLLTGMVGNRALEPIVLGKPEHPHQGLGPWLAVRGKPFKSNILVSRKIRANIYMTIVYMVQVSRRGYG